MNMMRFTRHIVRFRMRFRIVPHSIAVQITSKRLAKNTAFITFHSTKCSFSWVRNMLSASRSAALAVSSGWLACAAPASAQMPVPPPVEQSTADCARPTYASDQLVCTDPELRQMDAQLAEVLRIPAALTGTSRIESDGEWFKRRSRCAFETDHRLCLLQSYRDRLALIESATQSPARTLEVTCPTWGRVDIDEMPNGYMFLRTKKEQALKALASPASGQSSWKPAWTVTRRLRYLDFTSHEGRRISCKTKG